MRANDAAAPPLVTLDEVGVELGGRSVLREIDLEIRAGEFIGLIGSNGAGKTTLLRVLLGLQAVSHGRVRRELAGPIGYVPQQLHLDPDLPLRARDVVALGFDGQRFGIALPSRARQQLVEEMLDAVGASAFADVRVGRLSGGEQQRVLIAHALVSSPPLLLLDEPLANLDLHSEQEVVALLQRLAQRRGLAVLLSAHDMNPLLPVMDRIVYLAEGRAASGTVAEIVRPEVLSALYGHHVDVLRVHDRVVVVAGSYVGPEVPVVLHDSIISLG